MPSLPPSPVRHLLKELQNILKVTGTSPKVGSPADQEIRTFPGPSFIKTALAQANMAIEASADHLETLDRLVGEAQYALAPWTCARGVLEASAIATWLLDAAIDANERVSRSLALRFSTLQERRKSANVLREDQEVQKIDKKIKSMEQTALQLGYSLVKNS